MAEPTLLVYEMNGAPLAVEARLPCSFACAGHLWNEKCKWITRIDAVNYDFKGYWQRREWNDTATYKTMSRIDTPNRTVNTGNVTIAGIRVRR